MAPLSSLAGALTKKAHTLEWFQFFSPLSFPYVWMFCKPSVLICFPALCCTNFSMLLIQYSLHSLLFSGHKDLEIDT